MNRKKSPEDSPLSEEKLGELLARTGARPTPPPDFAEQVRQEVHAAWRESVDERRKRSRWRIPLAAAASLALAVTATVWMLQEPLTPAPTIATLVRAADGIEARQEDGSWHPINSGEPVSAGLLRTTVQGLAVLRTATGNEIRVAGNSEVDLIDDARVHLVRGAVYIDSTDPAAPSVAVHTLHGVARDIGTRFEVRVQPDGWRVQVRDGIVELTDDTITERASAGERVEISKTNAVVRQYVAANDDSWGWASAAAPAFDIDGASLDAYLAWVAHETGEPLRYDNEATRAAAEQTTLHGSIEGLTPAASLNIVLGTTDFRQDNREGGTIFITREGAKAP